MSKSKSKILSPKAWYLVAAGGVALAADGARRLIRRRRTGKTAPDTGYQASESIPITDDRPAEAPLRAAASPQAPTAAKAAADDLTAIKGIGPVFAKRLNEAGIVTFADVAAASADQLREVTHATAVANPEEWIAEARSMKM